MSPEIEEQLWKFSEGSRGLMSNNYVSLHNHTHFSVLDGHGKPDDYFRRAAELNMSHFSITDHGSLGGIYQGWKSAQKHGVQLIAGIEAYIAPTSRRERTPEAGFSGSGKYGHITLLAADADGYRNLLRLQADAFTNGFYGKPRIDLESLSQHSEGLIVTTGCAAGHVGTYLRQGEPEKAEQFAQDLFDVFGENLFVELMDHGIDEPDLNDAELNRMLIELAKKVNLPLVATNDSHYCNPEDHDVQQALLCVSTRDVLSNPNRFKFNGDGFHLKSYREMCEVGLPEESLKNTLLIAERIGSYDEVFAHTLRMPKYSENEAQDLIDAAEEGLRSRKPHATQEDWDRLYYELEVIIGMGYPGYFLVEANILRKARNEGVRIGPGRGSAGGSLVAYSLGITDLDPIAHDLLFERFLNPSRISLPDIDVDVAENQRPRLLELVVEEHGHEHVAIIGTNGTIGAKAALKDANRVLGGTYSRGEEYCRHLPPPKFGRSPSLVEYSGPRDEVFGLASGLEGTIRQKGQHAAAVIISPDPLEDLIPKWRPANQEMWVTENDMHELDALGFVKMDYLGLRNLGIIDDVVLHLSQQRRTDMRLPLLPDECNDPTTYRLLSSGNTLGVFQLDSPGMRGLLRSLKPTSFTDISAVLALYRPGPMGANAHTEFAKRKNQNGGRWQSNWAIHSELEAPLKPVLEETFGLIVYQEQVLEALNVICGWTYAEAELVFKAMAKKNHEKMAEAKPDFEVAGTSNGYSPEALQTLWDTLVPFADYSFNRAHTAGYGLVAYWTAFLKANFPNEYMAALLSSVSNDPPKLQEYLEECERIGVNLLPPDINESNEGFTPTKEGIRYGLAAIKGVGEKAFGAINRCRPFSSLADFFTRAPSSCLNAGVVGALGRSGSFDSLVGSRAGFVAACDRFVSLTQADRAERTKGQPLLVTPTYDVLRSIGSRSVYAEWERGTLGVALTQPRVILRVLSALSELDFEYIRQVCDRSPGTQEVTLDFGLARYTCGTMKLSAQARRDLEALGKIEVIEE